MLKVFSLFLSLMIFSVNSLAVEPILDQQGMFYFNMTFDAGTSKKTEHDFGFRFDRALIQPDETIAMNQLSDSPAVFNLKLSDNGLKTFELNGIDYSQEIYVAQADDEPQAKPRKKVNIPLGVIIGVGIGALALAGFN